MLLLFFAVWVLFNGRFTLEIALFGVAVATGMFWFVCRFMGYSIKKDLHAITKIGQAVGYLWTLVVEVIKANTQVIFYIMTSKYEVQPKLVHFKTNLKQELSKVVLANSITLTPGTITVSLTEDEYVVHCLDEDLADGMESSVFVQKLHKMEGTKEGK